MKLFVSLKVAVYILFYAFTIVTVALKKIKKQDEHLECYDYFLEQENIKTSCCKVGSSLVKCKPYFIIAGTQKSGTTALSAFLSDHPDVNFHPKKEAHFFDRNKSYNKGILSYLNQFNNITTGTTSKSSSAISGKYIYGESTPFYLASRNACERIQQMLPDVKLIILLREPVSRAYSEYQMKKRRVNQQNEFIQLMQTHAIQVTHCMIQHSAIDALTSLKQCLPIVVTQHGHWNKFVSANYKNTKTVITTSNKKLKRRNTSNQESDSSSNTNTTSDFNIVSKCYADSSEVIMDNNNMMDARSLLSSSSISPKKRQGTNAVAKADTILLQKSMYDMRSSHTYAHSQDYYLGNKASNTGHLHSNLQQQLLQQQHNSNKKYNDLFNGVLAINKTSSTLLAMKHTTEYTSSSSSTVDNDNSIKRHLNSISTTPLPTNNNESSNHHSVHKEHYYHYFQPIRCLGKSAKEYLLLPGDALLGEIKEFHNCAAVHSRRQKQAGNSDSSTILESLSLSELDDVIKKCVKVKSGITRQYIFRSLYIAQLYHCLKSILPNKNNKTVDTTDGNGGRNNKSSLLLQERVLILPSERLQQQPQQTINQILTFLHLNSNSSADNKGIKQLQHQSLSIEKAVAKYFPNFEVNTGWRLNSTYEPLDRDIAAAMNEFFKPYNTLLFQYLNINAYPEWR